MKIDDFIKEECQNSDFKKSFDIERGKLKVAVAVYNARTDAGLTQAALSQLAGLSPKTIAAIEQGDNVSFDDFFAIMSVLGKEVEIKVL
ncbi:MULTISPECIES: helix-turn-helix transcriptional regulator [Lactiplantibacillus]|jgi:DNA-binding XRE family transcriptional regulator|uniref:Helix-turn-helix transcriptional regulator n=2 Tax=Lactiplantibacillus pentosus TaxID=1589 RepID=A0A2K9I5M1_LACPE|nr:MULTISPECIES: helix-turn-helix transcriptional regulator [Lactiplantibacillus]AUI79964.1 transcriptional regulator [Lactiplantibacillus pentosus]MBO9165156.1 helix-turn-helix transcriptional regulator [Lactiplantibacillus pentosus]MBU7448493.1 helix-turn-helix transcriptional regulator [Lactiplantibacillus sp. 7.2.4]MBU7460298.1 helix-turn-helix transcriptional regulator [Lactiplantibacillus pentosus]MBU7473556.1 helix-turn-helix transcriptional regulator [Lactiplantibacillus pentosus]